MEKRLTKEEFLKDLWHTASEKPNIKQGECCVTCLVKFKNGSTELCVYFRNPEGWVCDDMTPYWAYRQGYYCGKKDAGKLAGDHRLLKAMRLTKKWKSRKIRNEANKMLKKNPLKPRDLQRSVLRLMGYGCSKA